MTEIFFLPTSPLTCLARSWRMLHPATLSNSRHPQYSTTI